MLSRSVWVVACAVTLFLAFAGPVAADEILFLNGDRVTGKILSADGNKLTIKTETAGEITVDMSKVKTFSTDEPVVVIDVDDAATGVGNSPGRSRGFRPRPHQAATTFAETLAYPPFPLRSALAIRFAWSFGRAMLSVPFATTL